MNRQRHQEIAIRNCSAPRLREDPARGFEPDSYFYIQNARQILDKTQIDLRRDPPLDKFSICAQIGAPEIWRWRGGSIEIFALGNRVYGERDASLALPRLDPATLTRFVEESKPQGRTAWLRSLRDWARQGI